MMADLFAVLLRFARWIDPEDPASLFMWIVIGGTALIVCAIFWTFRAIDRRRDRVNLATDSRDEPLAYGDHVEVPSVPARPAPSVPMPPVASTLSRRPLSQRDPKWTFAPPPPPRDTDHKLGW